MLIEDIALYEDNYSICINNEEDPLFYFFDYDTRSADINMQFQHFHTCYELCILLCPKGIHFLEGKPYNIKMFDIIGIPPNVLHRTQYPAGPPCRRLIIQFKLPEHIPGLPDNITEVFHQEVPIFRFEARKQQKIFQLLNEIFTQAKRTDAMRDLTIHLRFIEFLSLLFLYKDSNQYTSQEDMSPMASKIFSITNYIHTHYTENLSLELLAGKYYISSFYLSHKFKEITGFAVTDYIQMTRIRNVQAQLLNTQEAITTIAQSCGFCSFSQFNRVFKKHVGISPSEYRKNRKSLNIDFIDL